MQSTYLNSFNTTANAIVLLKWIGYSPLLAIFMNLSTTQRSETAKQNYFINKPEVFPTVFAN